jgi:hypothetical protein
MLQATEIKYILQIDQKDSKSRRHEPNSMCMGEDTYLPNTT